MMQKVFSSVLVSSAFILLFSFRARSQSIESVRIDLQLKDGSLKELIRQIERMTSFKFVAKAEDIENEFHINIIAKNESVAEVLSKILSPRNLEYKQVGTNILIKRITTKRVTTAQGTPVDVSQSKYSVHGTVKSSRSGETVIGASISVAGSNIGTVSNEYGFYSLTLVQGDYEIIVSAIGMAPRHVDVTLDKNIRMDFVMEEETKDLEAVTVTAAAPGRSLRNPQMSIERINVQEIKDIPVLFGERDVLKTIQLLPGVKAAGEGNSGFFVRGGAADQNLILLDEAPVYNASHLLGFFSTFNSDAIKNVTLYKGAMPAQFGGRLSSVVDIKMNEGNNQDFGASGGIGLIASRLNIEGPIQKDKSSLLLSGRRTYADLFLKLFGDSSIKKTKLYFYDLNAKMNFILGEKDRLYLSGYFGRDALSQDDLAGINWGNATGTLRWNHIFNSKLFSNTSLIFSNYDYKIDVNTEASKYGIFSRIRDWNVKEELQFYANSSNTLTFGVNSIYHTIKPGEISVTSKQVTVDQGLPDRYSLENALYVNNSWKATDRIGLSYGLRVSAFTILGKGDYYTL